MKFGELRPETFHATSPILKLSKKVGMSRGQTLCTIREMRNLKEGHTLTKASSPTKRIPALRETTAPSSPFTEIVISSDMRATF